LDNATSSDKFVPVMAKKKKKSGFVSLYEKPQSIRMLYLIYELFLQNRYKNKENEEKNSAFQKVILLFVRF
jgi:hypothetical protein